MKIAILTRSTAVHQALESLVCAAGHTPDADTPELALIDTKHPAAASPAPDTATLMLGGEDGLPCPIHPNQLIRHLSMLQHSQPLILAADWTLDTKARQLAHGKAARVMLTEKECHLLQALLKAGVEGVARDTLLHQVWGVTKGMDTHTLETHIYRLRIKLEGLEPSAGTIVTRDGNYQFSNGIAA